jgi:thiamine-phosphate pyrophosphorylase
VGQTDLPAIEARKLIGRHKILGVSTHNLEQARQAVEDGADYIGVGPIFKSSTKTRDILPGLDYARQVATEIRIPAIAIAGITPENVDKVLSTGLRAVAVTASVIACDDVRSATERLKAKLVGPTERR